MDIGYICSSFLRTNIWRPREPRRPSPSVDEGQREQYLLSGASGKERGFQEPAGLSPLPVEYSHTWWACSISEISLVGCLFFSPAALCASRYLELSNIWLFSQLSCVTDGMSFFRVGWPLTFMSSLSYIRRNSLRPNASRSWRVCWYNGNLLSSRSV